MIEVERLARYKKNGKIDYKKKKTKLFFNVDGFWFLVLVNI
jgi:hypothetical protein